MSDPVQSERDETRPPSVHELLLRLDLATEVLEGLDELGVDSRAELEALVERLEKQIGETT